MNIRRDGPTDKTVTLKYQTVDGNATSDLDYKAIVAGEVAFNFGEVLRAITVSVLDDSNPEGNETFYLQVYDIIGE